VLCSDRHVSADDIERELWSRGAAVGTATIYRTLDVMVRSGLVVERDFGEGFRRFEPARDEPNHEHLICTVCGRVVEFREERLERMTMLLAEQHDFARQRHKLVIEGICGTCRG
jgi:Fur family ferric uptake transcriptional regulator